MENRAVSAMIIALLLTGLLTLACGIQPVKTEATTIMVPSDYSTIQEAIDCANEGDTIYVCAGTYNEDLNIPYYKHVTIRGENRHTTILNGSIGGSGGTDYATIERLTILGSMYFSPTFGVTLVNNTIHGKVSFTFESGEHTIAHNTFYNGLSLGGDWGSSIVGNLVYGGISIGSGYRGADSCYIDIADNTIVGGVNGIYLGHASNHISIQYNTIVDASVGIFEDHDNSYSYFPWAPVPNNTIIGNSISFCGTGIRFNNPSEYSAQWNPSSCSNVSGNSFENNTYGIYCRWVDQIIIYHNSFVDNSVQLYVDLHPVYNTNNTYDSGYPSGGNYWSDYAARYPEAQELDDSGIWDTPYVIDADNRDRYPLMNPRTPTSPLLSTTIGIAPDTLNLKTGGKWITAYVELPEDYNVNTVVIDSVLLDGIIAVDVDAPVTIGDRDLDEAPDLMIKFDRADVVSYVLDHVNLGELVTARSMTVTLTVTGELVNEAVFRGTATIQVVCTVPQAPKASSPTTLPC